MDISLQKFSRDELIDFLTLFDDSFLRKPLVDNTKYFNKNSKIKKLMDGYRITNLPVKNIHEIYVIEIESQAGTPLEQTLLSALTHYFENIKVEESIHRKELDDLTKALQIQAAIAMRPWIGKDGKWITVLQVLKLFEIDLAPALLETIKAVSQVIFGVTETFKSQRDQAIADSRKKADDAIQAKQELIDQLTGDCRDSQKKAAQLETENAKMRSLLDEKEQEVRAAKIMVGESRLDQQRIETAKKELQQLKEEKIRVGTEIRRQKEAGARQLQTYQNDITAVKIKLEEIDAQKQLETGRLKELQTQVAEIAKTRDGMLEELTQREKISVEIEKRVRDKLQNTEECITEFFANYSLYAPNYPRATTPAAIAEARGEAMIKGMAVDDAPYEVVSETDLTECLRDNLDEAGVMKDKQEMLAAYLLAAYYNRMPLILAGANAEDIADAVAVTLRNQTADRMTCPDTPSISLQSEPGKITILFDAIGARNMSAVLNACTKGDGYFYYVAESSDELLVESKGLFNYALPLFTDFFVDQRARRAWTGCYCNLQLNAPVGEKMRVSIPRHTVSTLTFNICCDLMTQHAAFKKRYESFDGFLLQTLPMMMILGKTEELMSLIDKENLSDNDKKHLLMFCGEE
jgi:hypothetical protein